jgi:hypothetical protein
MQGISGTENQPENIAKEDRISTLETQLITH